MHPHHAPTCPGQTVESEKEQKCPHITGGTGESASLFISTSQDSEGEEHMCKQDSLGILPWKYTGAPGNLPRTPESARSVVAHGGPPKAQSLNQPVWACPTWLCLVLIVNYASTPTKPKIVAGHSFLAVWEGRAKRQIQGIQQRKGNKSQSTWATQSNDWTTISVGRHGVEHFIVVLGKRFVLWVAWAGSPFCTGLTVG